MSCGYEVLENVVYEFCNFSLEADVYFVRRDVRAGGSMGTAWRAARGVEAQRSSIADTMKDLERWATMVTSLLSNQSITLSNHNSLC